MGEHYYERFVRVGLTCGGPGDVLQAPDSQSAAALLDSFVTLFEATRDRVWIDRARATAHLLASWVISYDAPAAGRSCADSRRARDRRRVLERRQRARLARLRAVVGRRAAAPLPRDRRRRAAGAAARHGSQPGAVSARDGRASEARASDDPDDACRADSGRWLEPGVSAVPEDGVFDAIGLLSYTEVPGIYVRVDTGFVFVFDHLTARVKERTRGRLVLAVANPTKVDATVRILSETADGAAEPLRPGAVLDAQTAVVPAGATIQVSVPPL